MNVTETLCRTTAEQDKGALAYDHQLGCTGIEYCRIRTLSDQHQTPAGWSYENGTARNVTQSNKLPVSGCFLRLV